MTRPRPSLLLLVLGWFLLGVRIVLAAVRGESFRSDLLTLVLFAFIVATAVLGSRVYLAFEMWRHPPEPAHPHA